MTVKSYSLLPFYLFQKSNQNFERQILGKPCYLPYRYNLEKHAELPYRLKQQYFITRSSHPCYKKYWGWNDQECSIKIISICSFCINLMPYHRFILDRFDEKSAKRFRFDAIFYLAVFVFWISYVIRFSYIVPIGMECLPLMWRFFRVHKYLYIRLWQKNMITSLRLW